MTDGTKRMSNKPLIPESKLPSLGTTIFTQMSALAQQHQAINLSQGFPDFDGPRYLQERLTYHVAQGANQYAPMTGVAALRDAIVDKTEELYGYRPDANSDVTVTAGATEALYAAITALVRSGDEVICFDPSYDSYAPAIELSGGVLKRIALQPPHFRRRVPGEPQRQNPTGYPQYAAQPVSDGMAAGRFCRAVAGDCRS